MLLPARPVFSAGPAIAFNNCIRNYRRVVSVEGPEAFVEGCHDTGLDSTACARNITEYMERL